ncbi:hypothetical protein RYX36_035879 [Vicia faba]
MLEEVFTHALETIVEEVQAAPYAAEFGDTGNPLNYVPDNIAENLEQRCYKDLRNESFGSVKVILCICRKLLSSCKEQIFTKLNNRVMPAPRSGSRVQYDAHFNSLSSNDLSHGTVFKDVTTSSGIRVQNPVELRTRPSSFYGSFKWLDVELDNYKITSLSHCYISVVNSQMHISFISK